eukprot:TRINITY_DN2147_c0_g3_i1.p1 TRINITY_DN2147_c0_g3~~TRINITY_DN2147_c0_g3_i1.p1  ORF type:complete len:154 (-),score=17.69 TRINITY_DN2147_c0_g3_i1:794-1255(-)
MDTWRIIIMGKTGLFDTKNHKWKASCFFLKNKGCWKQQKFFIQAKLCGIIILNLWIFVKKLRKVARIWILPQCMKTHLFRAQKNIEYYDLYMFNCLSFGFEVYRAFTPKYHELLHACEDVLALSSLDTMSIANERKTKNPRIARKTKWILLSI